MEKSDDVLSKKTSNKVSKLGRLLLTFVIASGLFFGGWGIGSGRITLDGQKKLTVNRSPNELDFTSVDELYSELKSKYDGELDMTKLTDGLKVGLAQASGDPYTEYFNEEGSKEFNQELSGTFSGIGAELGKDGDRLVVISPITDSPAYKAGLQPKDVIVTIDDQSAVGLSVSQAVDKIRGKEGTNVKIGIIRNETESLTFDIIRTQINIPSVKWIIKGDVGVLTVSRFWDDTASLAEKAANEFNQKGIKKVILDLRGDPGGSLNAAVALSSLWLDKGQTVLMEKQGGKTINTLKASGNQKFKDTSTVVLINEGSASASEITAGALKDNNKATLLGVKSYGKGSVQQVIPLKSGGTLKVTVARWYTPADKNIDKEGIIPDQEVKRTLDDIKAGRDPQLDAAISKLQ